MTKGARLEFYITSPKMILISHTPSNSFLNGCSMNIYQIKPLCYKTTRLSTSNVLYVHTQQYLLWFTLVQEWKKLNNSPSRPATASTKYQSFQYNSSFQPSRACYLLEKIIVSRDPIHKIMYRSFGLHSVNESEKKTL